MKYDLCHQPIQPVITEWDGNKMKRYKQEVIIDYRRDIEANAVYERSYDLG